MYRVILYFFTRIADKLPISKEVEPLLEIDRNPRKLEAFLSSKSSSSKSQMLTIADLKKFLPCTINLDPYLRKLIRGNYYCGTLQAWWVFVYFNLFQKPSYFLVYFI